MWKNAGEASRKHWKPSARKNARAAGRNGRDASELKTRIPPAINKPRYMASKQHFQLFARYDKTQMLWIQTEDYAISGGVATCTDVKLAQRRIANS